MEIDAVADCNKSEDVCSSEKLKMPTLFSELTTVKSSHEAGHGDTGHDYNKTPKITHMNTDSITASLLAISDKTNLDYYRQKARKRISNLFGPWVFPDKWVPRKNPGRSRGKKNKSTYSSSFPNRHQLAPDEKDSMQHRHLESSSANIPHESRFREQTKNPDDVGVTKQKAPDGGKRARIRPATVPAHYPHEGVDSKEILVSNEAIQGDENYPKHSLPTLITLRPANSNNYYDTVFSLGKSSLLSNKDLIISMGQSNKLSTGYKRQAKSALPSDAHMTDEFSSPRGRDVFRSPTRSTRSRSMLYDDCEEGHIEHEGAGKMGAPKVKDAISNNRHKPLPPMCEHVDISQHMRHYRMHNTVRGTGRFSLANDEPEHKEIPSVQWSDVFPHRPLPNPAASETTLPVFRFSVSDFRREPVISEADAANGRRDGDASHSQMIKADLHHMTSHNNNHNNIITYKSKPKLVKATIAGSSEATTAGGSASRGLQKKDIKISLSPTVRPVMKSPQSSLNLDTANDIDKSCPGSGNDNMASSEQNKSTKEGASVDFDITNNEKRKSALVDADVNKTVDSDGYNRTETSPTNLTRNESLAKGGELSGWKPFKPEIRDDVEKAASAAKSRLLPKTQAYIQSSFSVYNDTIQNVAKIPSEPNTRVTSDYKEYLKQKKKKTRKNSPPTASTVPCSYNSLDCENSAEDKNNGNVGDDLSSLPTDPYYELIKSRFRSPSKFSHILRELIGFTGHSNEPSYSRNFEAKLTKDEDIVKLQQLHDGRRRENFQIRASSSRCLRRRSRATLTIDTQQLRDSVERKIYEGNKILTRKPLAYRAEEYTDRFVRFLVKEELEQQKASLQPQRGRKQHFSSKATARAWGTGNFENESSRTKRENKETREKTPEQQAVIGTASTYDLNETLDDPSIGGDKTLIENGAYKTKTSQSPAPGGFNSTYITDAKKVWKPNASRWCKKPSTSSSGSSSRPTSRPTSSAFHYRPASSSSSAYVIASPPMQMGFDERGVVLPLDEFVHMAMKSREGSFSALSQSVNAVSKVGIAPNNSTVARNNARSSVRKTSDDGFVRVVSFATPVNQFIFAKRITGYPLPFTAQSNVSSATGNSGGGGLLTTTTAEEAGRDVLQRKKHLPTGSFRLSLSDVKQSNSTHHGKVLETESPDNKAMELDHDDDDDDEEITQITENFEVTDFPEMKLNQSTDSENCSNMEKDFAAPSLSSNLKDKDEGENDDEKERETTKSGRDFRKTEYVNTFSLLQNVQLDGDHTCKDEIDHNQLHIERPCERAASSADSKNLYSALRRKVVRLAEIKRAVNDRIPEEELDQQTECSGGQNDFNKLPSSRADDLTIDQDDNTISINQSHDLLASKFSQLRQRRKKALKRNNIIKQTTAFVRKSFPPEKPATVTIGKLKMTSSDKGQAGRLPASPWRQTSMGSIISATSTTVNRGGSQCPKTVRFACDCDDIIK